MSKHPNPHQKMCPWYESAETFGAPDIKWCEETICHWVSEPANTWSNLLYLVCAFILYKWAKQNGQKEMLWFAPAMFLMGSFSFFYHMSNFYISQAFDFIGMYFFVFWALVLNLRKAQFITRKMQRPVMISLSLIGTVAIHILYTNGLKLQFIIVITVATLIALEIIAKKKSNPHRHFKYLISGLSTVFIAEVFSLLDLKRVWCEPTNHIIQGHGIWHIISAIGLTIAYKHFAQEDYSQQIIN
ncbi:MAG: ceramidase [Bacteriovoracaceae bacterium]|jgi:hypothetical protein|nr:ceramidase [Bacteriovoracaceae bacterium]